MSKFLFAFLLKCHNDETDKDVQHKEADDDDEGHEEDDYMWSMVENWTMVLGIGIDGVVCIVYPTLRSGNREQGDKSTENVIKIKVMI